MTALILGGLVAAAAVLIVALPFLRASRDGDINDATPATDRLLALMEARDRALGALKELEFDHRSGKVDDIDYRQAVGPLRREAAESLQALDRLKNPEPSAESDPPAAAESSAAAGPSAEEGVPE